MNTDLLGIAASSTTDGFAVATVDTNGNLRGWSYSLATDGTLTAKTQNVALGSGANGTVGVASSGNTVLFASSTSAGTSIYPRAANDLSATAPQSDRADLFAAPVPLATSGGTFAFLSQHGDSSVTLRLLDGSANDVGTALTLTTMADMAYSPTIVAGPDGYGLVYGAFNLDGGAAIALYDKNLNAIIAPQKIESNPSYYAEQPVLSYADHSNLYLASWHIKDTMGKDIIQARLLAPGFVPVGDPFQIANDSNNAAISTDGTNFYLSYLSYGSGSTVLAGSKITPEGAVSPIDIGGNGGTPSQWTFVERGEQSVLVWRESGGSGADLYFVPMCN